MSNILRNITIFIMILVCTTILTACGKEKAEIVQEKADITNFDNDIYAKEGEIDEPKDKDDAYVDTSVNTTEILQNALNNVASVRMVTAINVAPLNTSESVETESETEESTENSTENSTEENVEEPQKQGVKGVKKSFLDTKSSQESTKESTPSEPVVEETMEDVTEENTEGIEEESAEIPVVTTTNASDYYINLKVTTDIDSTKAKTYGRLRMDLGTPIDKEIASYDDYSVEPAQHYEIKHNVIREEGTETVTSDWYAEDSNFVGIATIKEILEKSTILSYNDAVDSHVIGLNVEKELAKKLDVTNSIMDLIFEGKDSVPMTCSISKTDGILTRIVISMDEFSGKLSEVNAQTKNYIITFDKYNTINKVLIPDTVMSDIKTITGHENFLTDEELIKYNFEKMSVEQTIEQNGVVEEPTESENTGSADEVLKATQKSN